jgi:hypothetical protein
MTPNLIFERTIFEIKKIKKSTFSKEWISKEKNEFRKNVIRSIDLSRNMKLLIHNSLTPTFPGSTATVCGFDLNRKSCLF